MIDFFSIMLPLYFPFYCFKKATKTRIGLCFFFVFILYLFFILFFVLFIYNTRACVLYGLKLCVLMQRRTCFKRRIFSRTIRIPFSYNHNIILLQSGYHSPTITIPFSYNDDTILCCTCSRKCHFPEVIFQDEYALNQNQNYNNT